MLIVKVMIGALIGAAGGLLLGRSRVCSRSGCQARVNRWAAIIAGALFGAAVAYSIGQSG